MELLIWHREGVVGDIPTKNQFILCEQKHQFLFLWKIMGENEKKVNFAIVDVELMCLAVGVVLCMWLWYY